MERVRVMSIFFLAALLGLRLVRGHGSLRNPPARNIIDGNYDANALNCGGYGYQWGSTAQGRCGVCGDPWNAEGTGRYATGTQIVAAYSQGAVIDVNVLITANHKGYFIFRIGKVVPSQTFTQESLNYVLLLEDGSDKWYLPADTKSYTIRLRLPSGLSCDHCVLQWWYRCGNNWGCDSAGCGVGFGTQENFVNCADVMIVADPTFTLPTQAETLPVVNGEQVRTTRLTTQAATAAPTTSATSGGSGTAPCIAIGAWAAVAGMTTWCQANCAAPYTNCLTSMCSDGCRGAQSAATVTNDPQTSSASASSAPTTQSNTQSSCVSVGAYAGQQTVTQWCIQNCHFNPPYCPTSHCSDGCRS